MLVGQVSRPALPASDCRVAMARCGAPWHKEGKRRTLARRTGHLDGAAVQLDESLDQAEAQSHATLAVLVVAGGVVHRVEAGEERLEQMRAVVRADADAPVRDCEPDPVVPLRAGAHPDAAAVGGELDRV